MKMFQSIINIRAWSIIIIVVGICLLQVCQGYAVMVSPHAGGTGGNTIDWYYQSPLTITENITDIGGGCYQYDYSFVNVDSSPIWSFGIYTTFAVENVYTFSGHSSWGTVSLAMTEVFPEYDARNLDPAILRDTHTWTEPWQDSATSIQIGEAASGFSFTALMYDPSPKYYEYETIASGYARTNGTGKVAAVGLTPEPATVFLLGLGTLVLLVGRRRR